MELGDDFINQVEKYRIIVIIGLPGSGKSNLMKFFSERKIYDDFIFYNYATKFKLSLKTDKVCLSDPRLCNIRIFNKFKKLFPEEETLFIFFENDLGNCSNNIIERNKMDDKKIITIDELLKFNKMYNLDNYNVPNKIVIPCFTKN